jgi:hypothetical protein
MREYIRESVELLLSLLDEQLTVLTEYKYVDTELIGDTWDSQLKKMAEHMRISPESYDLIEWYFLDGYVVVENERVIEDKEELIEYFVNKAIEKQKELN